MCSYMYIYICIYLFTEHTHIYIYRHIICSYTYDMRLHIHVYIYIYTYYVCIYIYTHRCIHRFHTLIIPSSFFSRLHYKYLLIRGTRRDKFKWEADGLGNHRRLRVTEDVVGSLGSWHLF